MDSNRIQVLEEKYWKGETSLAEEQELKRYVRDNGEDVSKSLADVFSAASKSDEPTLGRDFDDAFWDAVSGNSGGRSRNFQSFHFMRYAATGIIILGLSIGFYAVIDWEEKPSETVVLSTADDTFADPEKAFEETKRALFFASQKLNQGVQPVSEIKRFHHSQMSITGADHSQTDKK